MSDSASLKLLPTCRRCRLRKIRCNKAAPRCSSCVKAEVDCILVDPITLEAYEREYIQQLQQKELELKALLKDHPAKQRNRPSVSTIGRNGGEDESSDVIQVQSEWTPDSVPSTTSTSRPNAFVGQGSDLSLLHSIFLDPKWQAYKPLILHHLSERLQIPEQKVARNARPSREEASRLLENYFSRFHIHHTFLMRQDVLDIFRRIYHPVDNIQPSAQDHFRLFMVFSISAVTLYRKGLSKEHPYGYYLAAQAHLCDTLLVGSTDAIENLLLVCRFGMYHHIGTSLWELSQFCMRQCVELGLHSPSPRGTSLLKEQHYRRIFWECYILDRYSSGILGRPFAISEPDIGVELPINASDEAIIDSAGIASSLAEVPVPVNNLPTELSVFNFCIRLRRITSRILSEFYLARGYGFGTSGTATPMNHLLSGAVYVSLHEFMEELQEWRRSAPVFAEPKTLYERPDWYDFLLEKDRLLLVKGALHRAPRRNGQPPSDLLSMCLNSAKRIIELYNHLMQARSITWTRSYFQVIFAAGLSIIFCVSLGVNDKYKAMPEARNFDGIATTLTLCGRILQTFKREMPDAGRFAVVFEILKDNLCRDLPSQLMPSEIDSGYAPASDIQWDSGVGSHFHNSQHSILFGKPQANYEFDQTVAPENAVWPAAATANAAGSNSNLPRVMTPKDGQIQATSMTFSQPLPMDLSNPAQDQPVLGWPSLTDEMMENLEAGLGEFAWGALGSAPQDMLWLDAQDSWNS